MLSRRTVLTTGAGLAAGATVAACSPSGGKPKWNSAGAAGNDPSGAAAGESPAGSANLTVTPASDTKDPLKVEGAVPPTTETEEPLSVT